MIAIILNSLTFFTLRRKALKIQNVVTQDKMAGGPRIDRDSIMKPKALTKTSIVFCMSLTNKFLSPE